MSGNKDISNSRKESLMAIREFYFNSRRELNKKALKSKPLPLFMSSVKPNFESLVVPGAPIKSKLRANRTNLDRIKRKLDFSANESTEDDVLNTAFIMEEDSVTIMEQITWACMKQKDSVAILTPKRSNTSIKDFVPPQAHKRLRKAISMSNADLQKLRKNLQPEFQRAVLNVRVNNWM